MTISEIKKQAKEHKGMEMSMAEFRYCFGGGEKLMNALINEGVMKISGKYKNGSLKYQVA